ncbi:phosphotransferase enzyme family protein [Colletotrichum plurivorum]|uniref:Phosphotransferase enzyme family protein n=1 Tax=Colletotrichum plurivorum TaxID=2175906 RepID=A0A8H6KL18_9PEZI|nr:phosphotransferase enzyme family protein [Colletotrichum plurivorum]
MAPRDKIAEKNVRDNHSAWVDKLRGSVDAVVAFVDDKVGWAGAGKCNGYFRGSYNVSMCVQRGVSDENVLIRFSTFSICPAWRDEKVENEVMAMEYLREHTSLPIPSIRHWGRTEESPEQLGPFIIMDYMSGKKLSDIIKQPSDDKSEFLVLDPEVDEQKLEVTYEQIAGFMLELWRLDFPRIGAVSKDDASGRWDVTRRPLTSDMNELVTMAGCPTELYDDMKAFDRAGDFFAAVSKRNIVLKDLELAWDQYVARRCFEKLEPAYNVAADDAGPFRLFCDDLRPGNILVDPETLRITAVLDWEFTNAMPAQFSADVPWWLLLKDPASWVFDDGVQDFRRRFEPRKDQFIRAVERAEAAPVGGGGGGIPLSARMRDSWDSGRFWFNLAARSSFDVDDIYWDSLHKAGMGEAMLGEATLGEKEAFQKRKQEQIDQYLIDVKNDPRLQE